MNDLAGSDLARAWDARIEALLRHLPARIGRAVAWLREPSRKAVRLVVGMVLIVGGVFSILPVLGVWMLPLGLALLAEDSPGLKPRLERAARWCERRVQGWWGRGRPRSVTGAEKALPGRPAAQAVRAPVRPPPGA